MSEQDPCAIGAQIVRDVAHKLLTILESLKPARKNRVRAIAVSAKRVP